MEDSEKAAHAQFWGFATILVNRVAVIRSKVIQGLTLPFAIVAICY